MRETVSGRRNAASVCASHGPATVSLHAASDSAASAITIHAGSGDHAHGLAKREALVGGAMLDGLELLEGPAQPIMIDLDPFSANQGQAVGLREQLLDLGRRKPFAIERDLHLEIEQRAHPQL